MPSLVTRSSTSARPRLRAAERWLRSRSQRVTAPLAARAFLPAIIFRTENFGKTTWLGVPIWQNVLDLWTIQETIAEKRPSLLIETGTHRGGSALFYAH